jgi:hypothetical protein
MQPLLGIAFADIAALGATWISTKARRNVL